MHVATTLKLYHGTRDPSLTSFTEEGIGIGGDANSALGVFLCETAAAAVEYADRDYFNGLVARPDGRGRVLVVELEATKAFVIDSLSDFLGTDDRGEKDRNHSDFSAARERLLALGFDCMATDDLGELAGVWVALDTARLRVTGSLTAEGAMDLEDSPDYSAVEMLGGDLFASPAPCAFP